MKNFHCKNKRCHAVVGETDGVHLLLNGKEIPYEPLFISFNCPKCGEKVIWQQKGYKNSLQR